MTKSEMLTEVKKNLKIEDDKQDLTISDVILLVCEYCNINTESIPEALERIVRKKSKGIIDYEETNGPGFSQDIASIKEGDGTIAYATSGSNGKEGIYGLSDSDKAALRQYRRLRGYV
jgi:hypothetical protein